MGLKGARPPDRRIERTLKALQAALLELILEKGYDAITVQDLIDRADVGRSTYYTHFADKEDLLLHGFQGLRAFLREDAQVDPGRPLAFVRGVIDHAEEQRRLFKAIIGKRSSAVVHSRFRALLFDLVDEDLRALAGGPLSVLQVASTQFLVGALAELLTWWVDAKPAPSPDEIEAIFHQLSGPVLAAAFALPSAKASRPRR